jgi:hypothetical protein
MTRRTLNVIRAFLHGFSGAGLFRRLRYPGAPVYAVDPRSVEQLLADMPGLSDQLVQSALPDRQIRTSATSIAGSSPQVEHETHKTQSNG